jgi:N-acetylmuramoyl-L-alanine amidase
MTPENIILHHSLTKDTKTVSWGAIRDYHVNVNEWRDIGYHFGIELARDDYEILTGRMMNENAAHCPQHRMNRLSLGICFVGNYDIIEPPPEMWQLGIRLVKSLMHVFQIGTDHIYGHREFNPHKSCPGRMFDLDQFRSDLRYAP